MFNLCNNILSFKLLLAFSIRNVLSWKNKPIEKIYT